GLGQIAAQPREDFSLRLAGQIGARSAWRQEELRYPGAALVRHTLIPGQTHGPNPVSRASMPRAAPEERGFCSPPGDFLPVVTRLSPGGERLTPGLKGRYGWERAALRASGGWKAGGWRWHWGPRATAARTRLFRPLHRFCHWPVRPPGAARGPGWPAPWTVP